MIRRLSILALLLGAVLSNAVHAQMRRQAPGGMPDYDIARETVVKGSIVRTYLGPFNELFIVEISVDGSALHLFLGPSDVIAKQKFTFIPGTAIEAIGMPGFKVNGGPALLTRQIKSGKQTLTLRDATGKPLSVPSVQGSWNAGSLEQWNLGTLLPRVADGAAGRRQGSTAGGRLT